MKIFLFFVFLILLCKLSEANEQKTYRDCSTEAYVGTNKLIGNEEFKYDLKNWNIRVWLGKKGRVSDVYSKDKNLQKEVSQKLNQAFYSDTECVMSLRKDP
jgi:antitoxin component HigA of HigAB toxin-antitoxin module